jgi:phage terminase large subunit
MNITINVKKSAFNDIYYPHLTDYEKRYELYYGGSGSGKSVFVCQKLLLKAISSKRKVLIIRKVANTLKDSVFQLVIDMLHKWGLYSQCRINLSTFTITLPNNSILLFKGLEDQERIKSITGITDIWCEEITELTEEDYTQLDLRLRAMEPHLQLIGSFNPISRAHWIFKRWFAEDAVYDRDNTMILRTTYKHNRFLPQSYIDALEAKIHTNPVWYRIYVLGEFASLDKLIFNNWRQEEFNHADIKGQLLCGLDFGFVNDLTAFTASILVEEEKKIYVFKEWGDTNKTNNEIAAIIASLGFGKSVIVADSSEPKSIEELKRNGITRIKGAVKGKDSILHGIQQLQQYTIIIHPSCSGIITEFENYAWQKDKKSGEYINTPIDCFNHFCDSLRYSLQCVKTNKLKTLNKTTLSL